MEQICGKCVGQDKPAEYVKTLQGFTVKKQDTKNDLLWSLIISWLEYMSVEVNVQQ